MRKTNISNKLNRKPQAHARVCEENEEENEEENKEKKDCRLKYFTVKGSTLEACRRTVTQPIVMIFATRILHSIKVLVL